MYVTRHHILPMSSVKLKQIIWSMESHNFTTKVSFIAIIFYCKKVSVHQMV